MSNPVERYLSDCRVARLSNNTIKGYATWLKYLLDHVGDPDLLLIITEDDLRAFLEWFAARPTRYHKLPTNYTLHGMHRTLRTFFAWMVRQGIRADDPMLLLRNPRLGKRIVPRLSSGDLNALLFAAGRSHFPERYTAMLLLMIDSGLRVSEVCALRVEDVCIADGRLKVIGKGDKEREVPFGKRTALALSLVIGDRWQGFVNLNFLNMPMSKGGVEKVLRTLAKAANLPHITPHHLRHAMARKYLEVGDLRSLQLILGHANITTTEIYTGLDFEDVKARFKSAGVADRL